MPIGRVHGLCASGGTRSDLGYLIGSPVAAIPMGLFRMRVIVSGPAIAALTRDLKAAATSISIPNSRIRPTLLRGWGNLNSVG
jgi:hypothetical protein